MVFMKCCWVIHHISPASVFIMVRSINILQSVPVYNFLMASSVSSVNDCFMPLSHRRRQVKILKPVPVNNFLMAASFSSVNDGFMLLSHSWRQAKILKPVPVFSFWWPLHFPAWMMDLCQSPTADAKWKSWSQCLFFFLMASSSFSVNDMS